MERSFESNHDPDAEDFRKFGMLDEKETKNKGVFEIA